MAKLLSAILLLSFVVIFLQVAALPMEGNKSVDGALSSGKGDYFLVDNRKNKSNSRVDSSGKGDTRHEETPNSEFVSERNVSSDEPLNQLEKDIKKDIKESKELFDRVLPKLEHINSMSSGSFVASEPMVRMLQKLVVDLKQINDGLAESLKKSAQSDKEKEGTLKGRIGGDEVERQS